MKRKIKNWWGGVELLRYKMLAKDSFLASIYRFVLKLLYPILSTKIVLCSRIVNYRNRENKNLYEMILEQAHKDYRLKKDLILSYFNYHIVPWEYKLYHFESKTHKERQNFLSDADRYMCCELIMGVNVYETLKDKWRFYKILKSYYKRPIFSFSETTGEYELSNFCSLSQGDLFVKPRNGSLGRDTFIISSEIEAKKIFNNLKMLKGEWLIEGAIKQAPEMIEWKRSSVNTCRIPSFRISDEFIILQPFFRTGRKGAIVDNAGAGGILCVADPQNGIIITDGYDENLNVYEYHPDSHKKYKGWQIPHFSELKVLVKQIHKELPEDYIYVGFDFALTENGWDLIEGNWGQFIGQIATQEGIKRKFDKYIGICS